MPSPRLLAVLALAIPAFMQAQAPAQAPLLPGGMTPESYATDLDAILEGATRLPPTPGPLAITPPRTGWEMGMVSWIAADDDGLVYLLQRGPDADPVVVVDSQGRVVGGGAPGAVARRACIREWRSAGGGGSALAGPCVPCCCTAHLRATRLSLSGRRWRLLLPPAPLLVGLPARLSRRHCPGWR